MTNQFVLQNDNMGFGLRSNLAALHKPNYYEKVFENF